MDTAIGVFARLRPGEEDDGQLEVARRGAEQRWVLVRNLEFELDWVFDATSLQQDVYDRVAGERVGQVL